MPPYPVFMRTLLALGIAASAVAGCTNFRAIGRHPAALRAELAPLLPELQSEDIVIPHELSPENFKNARTLVSRHLGPKASVDDQVRALLMTLSSPTGLALRYEWAKTLDANETIEHGGGSCLSLSAVLVALARGMGIRAYFVDASTAANETQKDGEVTVHSGHIAVILKYQGADAFIDFAGELRDAAGTRRLDDRDVVAHYYNNRGYELIHSAQRAQQAVPWPRALESFRIAAKVAPRFALAWNNVGLALARLKRTSEAELAFRYALALDDNLDAARHNLASLTGTSNVDPAELSGARKAGLKWRTAAGGPAAIRWTAQPLPRQSALELGLKPEVPKAAVKPERR